MLKNAYLDAKIGFDTAENEPSKVRGFLIGVGVGGVIYQPELRRPERRFCAPDRSSYKGQFADDRMHGRGEE